MISCHVPKRRRPTNLIPTVRIHYAARCKMQAGFATMRDDGETQAIQIASSVPMRHPSASAVPRQVLHGRGLTKSRFLRGCIRTHVAAIKPLIRAEGNPRDLR